MRDYQLIDGLNSVSHDIPNIRPWLSAGTTYSSTSRSHYFAIVKGNLTVRADVTTDLSAKCISNGLVLTTCYSRPSYSKND